MPLYLPPVPARERVRQPLPNFTAGCFAETFPRNTPGAAGAALVTATPKLTLITLYAGEVVSQLSFYSTVALATATHRWAALCDTAGVVLAVSADQTSGAWGANAAKDHAMATPYVVPANGNYFIALCVVATTLPSPVAITHGGNIGQVMGLVSCTAPNTWTTTPPAVAANLGTLTTSTSVMYAWVS